MAALNGKWRLVSLENFEPYLDAVGMYLCFLEFSFGCIWNFVISIYFFMLTGGWVRLF